MSFRYASGNIQSTIVQLLFSFDCGGSKLVSLCGRLSLKWKRQTETFRNLRLS